MKRRYTTLLALGYACGWTLLLHLISGATAELVGFGFLFGVAMFGGPIAALGVSAEIAGTILLTMYFGLLAVSGSGAMIAVVRGKRLPYAIFVFQFVTLGGVGLLATRTTRAFFESAA